MFPTPPSALPLPLRPNLERYRKIAKELVRACEASTREQMPDKISRWAEDWVESLVELSEIDFSPRLPADKEEWISNVADFAQRTMKSGCSLADAQFVIARSHGFASWPKFVRVLRSLSTAGSKDASFEGAVDAIVHGDLSTLRRLLTSDPGLVRQRSEREHGATLLHYVSANGVEGYRQRTPTNVVEVTEFLLQCGALVDATAAVYGNACTTLELVATSGHPERAGVQEALLNTLLQHGARIELAMRDRSIVNACLANGRWTAARFLSERGARLDLKGAAGVGRLDLVEMLLRSNDVRENAEQGLLYACQFAQNDVALFLLEAGVDVSATDRNGQTPLHWAADSGDLETVKTVLRSKPPLEAKNTYGGTPLGQALWSAMQRDYPATLIPVLDALMSAGAKAPKKLSIKDAEVAAWLRAHGSVV